MIHLMYFLSPLLLAIGSLIMKRMGYKYVRAHIYRYVWVCEGMYGYGYMWRYIHI